MRNVLILLAIVIGLFFSQPVQAQTPLLQALIDSTPAGGTLTLPANVVYSCNCVINKSITIESNGAREVEAARGIKFFVGAKVITPNNMPALYVLPGVRNVRFRGIEVAPLGVVTNIVRVGSDGLEQDTIDEAPSHVSFENVWIHGLLGMNARRGIAGNGALVSVIKSRIDEIHDVDTDSQAFCAWNGPGPFLIVDSYLEASGENVMFGGGDAMSEALTPSDIEIRRNHFFKPLSWKGVWPVKNLFETKNARRLIVDGNVFENNWVSAQAGFAILIKSNNQDNSNPWAATLDLTFTNNTVKNSPHGLNVMGIENVPKLSGVSAQLKFINNLWLLDGIWVQGFQGAQDVVLDRNTVPLNGNGNTMTLYSNPVIGLVVTKNIVQRTGWGVKGDATGEGTVALNTFAPGWVFSLNVVAGAEASIYPGNNYYPASLDGVFVDPANENYRVRPDSIYVGLGCDIDELLAAQSGASVPPAPTPTLIPSPSPSPSPLPSPSPTPTPVPSPSPTPVPSPSPTPTPSPSPVTKPCPPGWRKKGWC